MPINDLILIKCECGRTYCLIVSLPRETLQGRECRQRLKATRQTHIPRVESENLPTHRHSARQGDLTLALVNHASEVDLDALYGLTLALVDGGGPRKDKIWWRDTHKREYPLRIQNGGRKCSPGLTEPKRCPHRSRREPIRHHKGRFPPSSSTRRWEPKSP